MRALLFLNGQLDHLGGVGRQIRNDDLLVAVDGGARHCLALGLTPHLVVGDFDSLTVDETERLRGLGAELLRYPPEKNETDLELAVEAARERGADAFLLVAAMGTRLDMTTANLLLLTREEIPLPLGVTDGRQMGAVLLGGDEISLDAPPGARVSVLALTPKATGISYENLAYHLENACLTLGSGRGLSNILTTPPARVRVATGRILVLWEPSPDVQ